MSSPATDASAPATDRAPDKLVQVVYVSSARRPFSEKQLIELLRRARANNERAHITGMLLYHEGNFIQALEGPQSAVAKLHEKIARDSRHTGMLTLLDEPIQERRFGGWSMGFTNIDQMTAAELEGFSAFLREPLTPDSLSKQPSRAQTLLMTFKSTLR
jgi:hypothetical protein